MKLTPKHSILAIITLALILITGCDKKETISPLAILTTNGVSLITETSATSGGNITSDEGSTVTSRGICWSETSNPTIVDNKTSDGNGIGTFTSTITGLLGGKTYYVRAYATNSTGTSYGNAVKFTTIAAATSYLDNDGNAFQSVNIGTQTWMAENLKSTKYRTGESISNVSDPTDWSKATFGAWCYYNNEAANVTYGKLYNWTAVKETRNIAPLGWHIATDEEWTTLINHLGGEADAYAKLKETGNTHWNNSNLIATNVTGFTALPGGYRSSTGTFANIGYYGYWWSATENLSSDPISARYRYMNADNVIVQRDYQNKGYGYSIRCVKDAN